MCAVLVLYCVWQLESVERGVYLIVSPSFTSSAYAHATDRKCALVLPRVFSFTLSLTEIRTAESLCQHLCVFWPLDSPF